MINKKINAELWIGSIDQLHKKTITYLQEIFCVNNCSTCTTCTQITEKRHHAVVWIAPEKNYTLDRLSTIFQTISLSLDEHQKHFFILQDADFLTPVCANALLKPLEEPPSGYHFILHAQQQDRILPTIRSRCIIKTVGNTQSELPSFLRFFTSQQEDPAQFLTELERIKPNERITLLWLDMLLDFWTTQYKKSHLDKNDSLKIKSYSLISMLKKCYHQLPMPGSAKIFWKQLFLDFKKTQ